MTVEDPSVKEIFDALTGDSADGCDPDWCGEILGRAPAKDLQSVRNALSSYGTESEAAAALGVRN